MPRSQKFEVDFQRQTSQIKALKRNEDQVGKDSSE
jgi:hypothetical protein